MWLWRTNSARANAGRRVKRSTGVRLPALPDLDAREIMVSAEVGQSKMAGDRKRVTYKGFRTADGWEVVAARPSQPLRLLDKPRRQDEWSLSILTDYFDDAIRAADLHQEFASITVDRFTKDWEMSGNEIERALLEVEVLRARWRVSLMRG